MLGGINDDATGGGNNRRLDSGLLLVIVARIQVRVLERLDGSI